MMNREILADHLNRERVRQQSVPPGPEDKVPKRIAPRDTTCALPSERDLLKEFCIFAASTRWSFCRNKQRSKERIRFVTLDQPRRHVFLAN